LICRSGGSREVQDGTTSRRQAKKQAEKPTDWRRHLQRVGFGVVMVWWIVLGMTLAAEQRRPMLPGTAPSEGQRLFVRFCGACHGVNGDGDGPAAPALQPPPADLTQIGQRHDGRFPIAEITAYIDRRTVIPAHGSREMPIWGVYIGERAGGGRAGEEVMHNILSALLEYLQPIHRFGP
jgi:mono/diheme cytochrome c family protein